MFDYDKAITSVSNAVDRGFDLVDDFFYTKEERAENVSRRAEDYHKFMQLSDMEAQRIRSKKRAQLVSWVVYPYVIMWLCTFPIMVLSAYYPQWEKILSMVMMWLKMYTPLVIAFGGPYIGYYGIQTVVNSFRNGKNKKE